MNTIPEVHCTCNIINGDAHHSPTCALQYCDAWVTGKLTWKDGQLRDSEEVWGWDAVPEQPTLVELDDDVTDDELYECTCFAPEDTTVTLTTQHDQDCDLQYHKGWMDRDCEWDHQTWSFVYTNGTPSTTTTTKGSAWSSGGSYGMFEPSCTHDGTKAIVYPDGTKIYPSSSHGKYGYDAPAPDYALYLEKSRTPRSAAIYIPWKDYGLPEIDFRHAADIICETYELAAGGMTVEVGCIGGHGRTGTVLACMAVLGGVPLADATEWVRTAHCAKAVESERQEWWVAWFHAYVNQLPAPPTPPEKPLPPVQTKNVTTSPGSGSLFDTDKGDDLVDGDLCPLCKTKIHIIGGKLCCDTKACQNYNGLPRCHECKAYLDAQPLEGYCCWNMHCKQWKIPSNAAV